MKSMDGFDDDLSCLCICLSFSKIIARVMPDRFGPDSVMPDRFGPNRVVPDRFGPDRRWAKLCGPVVKEAARLRQRVD
ncbi:hypothetical protein CsSME_00049328 [Camellia sinensis var. sinensis]